MVFSMRSLPGDSDLVGEAKFLGVTLDPRLQWGLHIDSVAGKATKENKGSESRKMVDITRDKPIKVAVRVVVPVRDHPKVVEETYCLVM
ncbi:unnamed protein product [Acanthoscelides obtectus]|uniref:Uncharacterized protein n=1 Tax=Acanthoscelides obtectus TaxID=200917 RepID=A0A9P0K040_ACAOB|nr:unnamed protein product [Acanthoscelides obtectus]CAK1646096.1 hypothetical protein AOBTE_LOCUS14455 [Acanthoscelides obtectus]